jgi:hypothetical protein
VYRTALLLLVLSLTACVVGDDDGGIEARELQQLVLQPEDLTVPFQRFDEGRQASTDAPGGRRADPSRFGRREGWKARYRRPGSRATAGALVIESKADLFESSGGAEEDIDAARADLAEDELGWQAIDEPGLGDESFAATLVQGAAGTRVRYYQVVWREANVTASLNVNGFEGRLPLADVLELARKQERRISVAAGA